MMTIAYDIQTMMFDFDVDSDVDDDGDDYDVCVDDDNFG